MKKESSTVLDRPPRIFPFYDGDRLNKNEIPFQYDLVLPNVFFVDMQVDRMDILYFQAIVVVIFQSTQIAWQSFERMCGGYFQEKQVSIQQLQSACVQNRFVLPRRPICPTVVVGRDRWELSN